jgi:hypothetical protein
MTKDRFKQNRKKTFKGHNTAGYACQVNFSPDSKYVMSGAKKHVIFSKVQLPLEDVLHSLLLLLCCRYRCRKCCCGS